MNLPDDNAVPQEASDSFNPGPPLTNFDDEHPIVREAVAIVTGTDSDDDEPLTAEEYIEIDARVDATDCGNCNRFVGLFGQTLRYVADQKEWRRWNGTRWAPDELGHVMELAKEVTESMFEEVAALLAEDTKAAKCEASKLAKWAKDSRSSGHIKAMVALAESDPAVVTLSTDFDRDPWVLGCENGYVDLRTGELKEPDPVALVTKSTGVTFDPSATCPNWERFISWVMLDREEMVSYFQKLLGYSLCGVVSERVVISMYGLGGNGKSTALNAMRVISGDYGLAVAAKTFEAASFASGGGGADPHITALQGARVVRTSEVEDGMKVAVNTLQGPRRERRDHRSQLVRQARLDIRSHLHTVDRSEQQVASAGGRPSHMGPDALHPLRGEDHRRREGQRDRQEAGG